MFPIISLDAQHQHKTTVIYGGGSPHLRIQNLAKYAFDSHEESFNHKKQQSLLLFSLFAKFCPNGPNKMLTFNKIVYNQLYEGTVFQILQELGLNPRFRQLYY